MTRTPALVLGLALLGTAASSAQEPHTYPLWPNGAPGAIGTDPGDATHAGDIPTLTVYLPPPEKGTGSLPSIVICPGGGYGMLASEHEGSEVAAWLNSLGVAGVVLKYRHAPGYRHPAPLDDARRAIRMVRWRSKEWGLDPDRVGVLGFSAGGHLATTLATQFRDAHPMPGDPTLGFTERPDVVILIYPVISLAADFGHAGSARNLLGPEATPSNLANFPARPV